MLLVLQSPKETTHQIMGCGFSREKTEKVTTKLEMVAESIAKILSEHVKNQRHTATLQKVYSVVCLRRHGDSYRSSEDAALSLHITGSNHKFRVHSPQSTSFTLPSCCLLVTVGKQLEVIAKHCFHFLHVIPWQKSSKSNSLTGILQWRVEEFWWSNIPWPQ